MKSNNEVKTIPEGKGQFDMMKIQRQKMLKIS